MIACLRGELFFKGSDRVVVDVNGVGYEVFCTQANLYQLPETGHEVFLFVHTDVRDDAINLYGFLDFAERKMFLKLTGVSGIGPKLALNILSGMRLAELARTIAGQDIAQLTRLPGVGRKTAERLCLELKDKMDFIPRVEADSLARPGSEPDDDDRQIEDVISALVNLGYPRNSARIAVDKVRRQMKEEFSSLRLEDFLRLALWTLA
ncbi:MAG: Holliday junction branch migration protein RuvA [Deltaproteobacteria bacterium]